MLDSIWKFYKKENEDLRFIDKADFEIYVYNVSELTSLLSEAGWETLAVYGNIVNCQQFGPWTAMNLVAKAIQLMNHVSIMTLDSKMTSDPLVSSMDESLFVMSPSFEKFRGILGKCLSVPILDYEIMLFY